MDPDQVVCNCMSVTVGMIQEAVESGAKTLEEVQALTQAGTVCGMCEEDLIKVVNALTAEKEKDQN